MVGNEIRVNGLRTKLPQHRGNLSPMVRGMIHGMLQLLNKKLGVSPSLRVCVGEWRLKLILGE